MTANKKNIVIEILKKLQKGITFSQCLEESQLDKTAFAKYWKEANSIHEEYIQQAQAAIGQSYVEAEKEFQTDSIVQKKEALEILSKIIRAENELRIGKEGIEYNVKPSFFDRNSAMALMSRMRGWEITKDESKTIPNSITRQGNKFTVHIDFSSTI